MAVQLGNGVVHKNVFMSELNFGMRSKMTSIKDLYHEIPTFFLRIERE